MAKNFRTNPTGAADQLNGILADGNQEKFLVALRDLTGELGGIGGLAERSGLNRTQLYKTLSSLGNPDLRRLTEILNALGLRLAVQPVRRPKARARRHANTRPAARRSIPSTMTRD